MSDPAFDRALRELATDEVSHLLHNFETSRFAPLTPTALLPAQTLLANEAIRASIDRLVVVARDPRVNATVARLPEDHRRQASSILDFARYMFAPTSSDDYATRTSERIEKAGEVIEETIVGAGAALLAGQVTVAVGIGLFGLARLIRLGFEQLCDSPATTTTSATAP